MRLLTKARSLLFARPSGITPECPGRRHCRGCDERMIRELRWPYGRVPQWVPYRDVLWISGGSPEPYEGFGATAIAANRGMPVSDWMASLPRVHVSNGNDSGTGSLRAALTGGAGSRFVDFNNMPVGTTSITVSGTGQLIFAYGSNVVVDGSTHPSGNCVTLSGGGLYIYQNGGTGNPATNWVVTYLRSRNSGPDSGSGGDNDAFGSHEEARNIIFDHLSAMDPADSCMDITQGSHDVTVQFCLLSHQNRLFSSGGVSAIAYAWAGTYAYNVSMHHNLFDGPERHPFCKLDDNITSPQNFQADVRCNICWNWGHPPSSYGHGPRGDWGSRMNVVKNYLKTDRSSSLYELGIEVNHSPSTGAQLYASGNTSGNGVNLNDNGNTGSPLGSPPAVTEHDPLTSAAHVLTCAGCRPLDSIDTSLVSSVSGNISGLPTVTCASGGGAPPPDLTWLRYRRA